MDPAVDVVKKYNPYPGSEEREDPPRLFPTGAEQQANEIRANQGEARSEPRADEGESRQRAQQVAAMLGGVTGQPAQGGRGDGRERVREFARWKDE